MPLLIAKSNLIFCCFFLVFCSSCGDKEIKQENPNSSFTAYISGYTSNVVSTDSEIILEFTNEVPEEKRLQIIEDRLITFSPKIKGQFEWANVRNLIFYPEQVLQTNTSYNISFELGRAFDVPKNLETFQFNIHTEEQRYTFKRNSLQFYHPSNTETMFLKGLIHTLSPADNKAVEKMVKAIIGNKGIALKWSHISSREHQFKIDSLRRLDRNQDLSVRIDGQPIGNEVKQEYELVLPNNSDFSVLDAKIIDGSEQSIQINFSELIDPNQNLNGLILLGDRKFTSIIESNVITIYPRTRLEGYHMLHVDQGIQNIEKVKLNSEFKESIRFKSIVPRLKLVHDGVIIPSASGLKFHFEAVNIKSTKVRIVRIFEDNIEQFFQENEFNGKQSIKRVGRLIYDDRVDLKTTNGQDLSEWNSFVLDLDHLFDAEAGAIYRVYLGFDQYDLLNTCPDLGPKATFTNHIQSTYKKSESDKDYWDYNGYDPKRSWRRYKYEDRDDRCKDAYYYYNNRPISQNIFCSNLGLIVKSDGAHTLNVATTDLISSNPKSNVDIVVTNFQGEIVGKGSTGNNGLLRMELTSTPFFVKAISHHERAYARIEDGSALSMSMFDVEGDRYTEGVKGYVYGERNVWRPGDSIYLNLMLLNEDENIPLGHPIHFKLLNPKNQIIQEFITPYTDQSIYPFHTTTSADAVTGRYRVTIDAGPFNYSAAIKIETIRPNRLKVNLNFNKEEIDLTKDKVIGQLKSTWLHGADAINLKTKVDMKLINSKTTFMEFPNYYFDDQLSPFDVAESTVYDGKLNESGEAKIEAEIGLQNPAPGKLTARFTTKVFEKGGGFSTDVHDVNVSPFNSYVGVYIPKGKGWRGALFNNQENKINVTRLLANGAKMNGQKIKIEIYKWNNRWWWDHKNTRTNFIQNNQLTLKQTFFADIKNGHAEVILPKFEDNYGSFIVRVIDPKSGHASSANFNLSYDWRSARNGTENKEGLTMLTFESDKDKYAPGEIAKIKIPSSGIGNTLVSLEKGTEILRQFWVENTNTETEIEIPITPDMAPNVYVNLSLIQPYNQSENDLPLRLYGVKSLEVMDGLTLLNPEIMTQEEWQPEKEISIKVSEKNGQPMEYTLAIVDEGLLDITSFNTPDPWNNFYAKEALRVMTWDMFDDVIGAQNGTAANLVSIGGDGVATKAGGVKANRFPPVIKFLGPFKMSAVASNGHEITLPNYVGSVRIMVVACGKNKYGHAEKAVKVKKPLMLLANLPRVLSPGEKLSIPINVFVMDNKIKNVDVEIKTDGLIRSINNKEQLRFDKNGDQQVYFDIEVNRNIGLSHIEIKAKSGAHTAYEKIEIDVLSPNPMVHKKIFKRLKAGQSWDSTFDVTGLGGTNEVTLEATNQLPINLSTRLDYLIRYPHGCIEQTTSSVFPQLFVGNLIDVSKNQKNIIEENIKAGINRIFSFQLTDGGIGYWPGAAEANPWGTNYAGHFMLEAKQTGYALPSGYLKNWIAYQKVKAENWQIRNRGEYNIDHGQYWETDLIQAYRLYTMALAGEPAIGAMNRMKNLAKLSKTATYRLALAYQVIGQKEIAKSMIVNLSYHLDNTKYDRHTFGSSKRNMAMILESYQAIGDDEKAYKIAEILSKALNSDHLYGTQTTSYMLLAMAKFNTINNNIDLDFSYQIDNDSKKSINSDQNIVQEIIDPIINDNRTISIKNKSKKPLYLNLRTSGVPFAGKEQNISQHLNLYVTYKDENMNKISVDKLTQGTDFIAQITVSHPGVLEDYTELALTQIIPSGWEIFNERINDDASIQKSSPFDFQDIRDDRVYTYFDLGQGQSKTFYLRLNAAFPGKFYLPAINCEAMYDHDITVTKKGQWIEVIKH